MTADDFLGWTEWVNRLLQGVANESELVQQGSQRGVQMSKQQ